MMEYDAALGGNAQCSHTSSLIWVGLCNDCDGRIMTEYPYGYAAFCVDPVSGRVVSSFAEVFCISE